MVYRDKAVAEARRLFGIFDGTRTFVMPVWILRGLLSEIDQQTHLAQQYGRALRHWKDPSALRAKLADRERRMRAVRDTLRLHQRLTGAQHTTLIDALDLRRPLRRGKRT